MEGGCVTHGKKKRVMITPINFSCLKEDFKCLWGVNDMGTKEEENKGVQNQN